VHIKKEQNPQRARLVRGACSLILLCTPLNAAIRGLGDTSPMLWGPLVAVNALILVRALWLVRQAHKLPSQME
jgi:hypothetical protein